MRQMYIVELGGEWLCQMSDTGWTFEKNSASIFWYIEDAERAVDRARKLRPFREARIVTIER